MMTRNAQEPYGNDFDPEKRRGKEQSLKESDKPEIAKGRGREDQEQADGYEPCDQRVGPIAFSTIITVQAQGK